MIVFRLSKGRHASDLSGRGAELAGGRWNSKGVPIVYTSESIALCTVEVAVHMPLGIVPMDYELISIKIPASVNMHEVKEESLLQDWKSFPHTNATQEIGDLFVHAGSAAVLKVPSATVQGNCNYLLNPRHRDFHKITIIAIEPFEFDKRLFMKS